MSVLHVQSNDFYKDICKALGIDGADRASSITIEIRANELVQVDVTRKLKPDEGWQLIDVLSSFNLVPKTGDGKIERIMCPNCGAIETARIESTEIFDSYVHHCSKCGHIILESEWEKVDE
jgi:hypothetical protein